SRSRVDEPPGAHPEEWRTLVRSSGLTALDMEHSPPGHRERVRDQGPMAAPRQGLGTHDDRGAPGRQLLEALEAGGKVPGLHVVSVAAEGGVAPADVDGVGTRVAEPAQGLQVTVADLGLAERARQRESGELWIVTRPRDGPDVHDLLHPVSPDELDQLSRGSSGVADRVQRPRRHQATTVAARWRSVSRIMRTGILACRSTASATEPNRSRPNPLRPWVVMAMRSVSVSLAAATISGTGSPCRTSVVTRTPSLRRLAATGARYSRASFIRAATSWTVKWLVPSMA